VNYGVPDAIPRINASGQVAFFTSITGSGVTAANNKVFWVTTPSGTEVVARRGSPAPGTPAGVNFNTLEPLAAINDSGQLAFTATLVLGTGVTTANDRGLWAGLPGDLSLVAREGDVIDVDPGPGQVLKTISSFSFANGSGTTVFDSASAAFNDAGQIAWQAQFTAASGGGTAVFLTTLPPAVDPTLFGDYNVDGKVDAADYAVWRKFEGTMTTLPNDPHDGTIGALQFDTWRANFGNTADSGAAATAGSDATGGALSGASASAVPEPATLVTLIFALGLLATFRGQRPAFALREHRCAD
jgi:hypothetical protein